MEAESKTPGPELTYVPAFNIPALRAKVDSINRRAARLGLPQVTLRETGNAKQKSYTCRVTGESVRYEAVEVELLGLEVKIPGWELIATLKRAGDENLILTVPGKTAPDPYATSNPVCDHCGTKRVRRETFVLKEEATGRHLQVGRDCIRDFLGHGSPETILWYAGVVWDLRGGMEDGFSGVRGHESWSLETVLELAAWCVRKYGWASSKATQGGTFDRSTRSRVGELLSPPHTETEKKDRRALLQAVGQEKGLYPEISDADKANAGEAKLWALSLGREDVAGNNYLANLHTIARFGFADKKSLGIAVSMLVARDNALQRERVRSEQEVARLQRREKDLESGHIGEVGKRGEFELTLERVTDLGPGGYSRYGETRRLLRFRDPAGNIAVWFTGTMPVVSVPDGEGWALPDDAAAGGTYTARATVKRHDEYKGVKQTVLARVSLRRKGAEPQKSSCASPGKGL